MFYLYHEHKSRNQYPQYFILQLLAMGCFVRCVWFFLAPSYKTAISMQILNRLAILFQFSAISLLMLMWDRALKVTNNIDRQVKIRAALEKRTEESFLRNALKILDAQVAGGGTRENSIDTIRSSGGASFSPTADQIEKIQRANLWLIRKRILWVVVNVTFYLFVIITIFAVQDNLWYAINLVSIAVLCVVVNIGILKVGLSNYFRLKRELSPVYVNSTAQQPSRSTYRPQQECSNCYGLCSKCFCGLDTFLFGRGGGSISGHSSTLGLRMQAQVIRVLLLVSFTVAIFFIIRAFCFLYGPVVEQQYNQHWGIGRIIYPLFYYQFPELFPNLAIAIGISPPKGLLRTILWDVFSIGVVNNRARSKSSNASKTTSDSWWRSSYWLYGNKNGEQKSATPQSVNRSDKKSKLENEKFETDENLFSTDNPLSGRNTDTSQDRMSGAALVPVPIPGRRDNQLNRPANTVAERMSEYVQSVSLRLTGSVPTSHSKESSCGSSSFRDTRVPRSMQEMADGCSTDDGVESCISSLSSKPSDVGDGKYSISTVVNPATGSDAILIEQQRQRMLSDALGECIYQAVSYSSSYTNSNTLSTNTRSEALLALGNIPDEEEE